jgi:DNA polymerase-3 subunit beta
MEKEKRMKFTIEKSVLAGALSKAAPLTQRRTTLPILSYLLLEAKQDTVTVTATDLESGIRLSIPAETSEPGLVCAPGRTMLQAISNLSDGPVSLSIDDKLRLAIKSGDTSMSLACLDYEDFPTWGEPDEDTKYATIVAGTLVNTLERVTFAASNEESRYNLNGIYFEQGGEVLNIVATDGHRLAFDSLPLNFGEGFSALLPKKNIIEMKKLLDGLTGDVTIGFNSQNMILTTETLTATARLVSTQYPDYRKVIPTEPEYSFAMKRDTCVTAVKRVAFLLSERNKGLNVNIEEGRVTFSTEHPDLGTASDSMATKHNGKEISAIINGAYLLEGLNALSGESLRLEYYGEDRPFILRPEGGGSYFNLVMPIRR